MTLFRPMASALLLILTICSCEKDPQPIIENTSQPVITSDPQPVKEQSLALTDNKTITVEVSFASAAANASSSITPLKYNKTSVVNFDFDDNAAGAYGVYQYFKNKTFSSGTGRQVKYTAAAAVNSKGNYNNGDLWENYQGSLTRQQAAEMVAAGWALENHGYYHNVFTSTDNYGFGKPVAENISDNSKTVLEKTGFKMRTLIVPSNDQGYLSAAFSQGLIATSSTNSFDGYQSYPLWGDYVDISTLPHDKVHLRRDFNDQWDANGVNTIKNKLLALFNKSNNSERMLYRLGTHNPDLSAFKALADYISAASNDNCWVTTMQEMVEYFQIKDKVIKKESMADGKLIITLDVSNVDPDTYFRDFTLAVGSDAPVQSIKVSNAKYSSSSNTNKLINISF